ncbi:hypothetical protein C8R43DRAFT_1121069 [Mycena crocata]|nr:hypothetical protein C8R43DRAFT_1121069 [Mycena crocata]
MTSNLCEHDHFSLPFSGLSLALSYVPGRDVVLYMPAYKLGIDQGLDDDDVPALISEEEYERRMISSIKLMHFDTPFVLIQGRTRDLADLQRGERYQDLDFQYFLAMDGHFTLKNKLLYTSYTYDVSCQERCRCSCHDGTLHPAVRSKL